MDTRPSHPSLPPPHRGRRPSALCGVLTGAALLSAATLSLPTTARAQTILASDYAAYRDLQPTWLLGKFSTAGGANPQPVALVYGPSGDLYGIVKDDNLLTSPYVFRYTHSSGTLTVLHSFTGSGGDGSSPAALAFDTSGNLWGVASGGGANNGGILFRIAPDGTYTISHSFSNTDGVSPMSLVLGHDGYLYGMTQYGGANDLGIVFKVNPADGTFSRLYTFGTMPDNSGGTPTSTNLAVAGDGSLFGMTSTGSTSGFGTTFRLTTAGVYTRIADTGNGYGYYTNTTSDGFASTGAQPAALATAPDGSVWVAMGEKIIQTTIGVSPSADFYGGSLLRIAPDASGVSTIFTFPNPPHNTSAGWGTFSSANLQYGFWPTGIGFGADGAVWGSTWLGGIEKGGTLFRVQADSSSSTGFSPKVIYAASGTGADPLCFVMGSDGNPYYASYAGLSTANAVAPPFLLHSFAGNSTDAYDPACVTVGSDGGLYGLTYNSDAIGDGTFFHLTTGSTPEHDTFQFLTALGYTRPNADLSQDSADGKFYGTGFVMSGDPKAQGSGGVFRLSAGGALERPLLFTGLPAVAQGATNPNGSVIKASDGKYYGVTYSGGSHGSGTVYCWDPAAQTVTVLHNFSSTGPEGSSPIGSLLQGSDGRLYGATSSGGATPNNGLGAIYSLDPNAPASNYDLQVLHQFTNNGDSGACCGGLVERNGFLYGTVGRAYYQTGVFKMAKDGSSFTMLRQFTEAYSGRIAAPMVLAPDGNLYGLIDGSDYTYTDLTLPAFGTIYQIDRDDTVSLLRHFHVVDGAAGYGTAGDTAIGRLAVAPDGSLYGVTPGGGSNTSIVNGSVKNSYGTVFHLAVGRPAGQPSQSASDVSSQVKVTITSHVLAAGVHRYTLTLTNTGASAMSGPVYLALDSLGANQFLSADGYTYYALPAGSPYALVASSALAPGATATLSVRTSKPLSATTHFRILSGTGGL